MAKLYFRYGTVGSAKTLNLLAVAHAYELQGKTVRVLKPKMDSRFGEWNVASRAGLDRGADTLVDELTTFPAGTFAGVDCILVDEVQFFPPCVIERLRVVASVDGVPVICYGLRTDFRSQLFPGSKRVLELADAIEEIKTTCTFCNRKGILNLKSVDGRATLDGPVVCLGCEEMYVPACFQHFTEKIEAASGKPLDFQKAFAKLALELEADKPAVPERAEPEQERSPMKEIA